MKYTDPSGTMLIEYGCMAQFAVGAGTTVGATGGGFVGGVLFAIAGALGMQQAPEMAAHMNNALDLIVALVPAGAAGGCGRAGKGNTTLAVKPTPSKLGTCSMPKGKANSFAAGTVVFTSAGLRNIEDVQVGDTVAAWNPETRGYDWKPVTARSSRQTEAVFQLTVRSDDGREETVRVTGNHPYLRAANDNTPVIAGSEGAQDQAQTQAQPVNNTATNADVHVVPMDPGGDWTAVGFLKPGDQLRSVDQGILTVTAAILDPTPTRVYTLTIADSHTYAVGELGAWVHNSVDFGGWPNQKIQNIMEDIIKRESELMSDSCKLPEFGPGPDRSTRQGHRRIITRLWKSSYREWRKVPWKR